MDEQGAQIGLVETALAASRDRFEEALRRGDSDQAAQAYTPDARLIAPSGALFEGRESIASFWRAGLGAGVSTLKLEALELEGQDGLAYEIGRYTLRLEAARGEPVIDRGKYVLVHAKQDDGSWLRAVETFTPDYPPVRPEGGPAPERRSDVQEPIAP